MQRSRICPLPPCPRRNATPPADPATQVTGVNPVVARSCAMIALGCALVPSPFAMAVLSMSALDTGPQGLVPIFATACTSYLLCLGVGWPQKLVEMSAKRQAAGKAQ